MDLCLICTKPVPDFIPERCCSGYQCGCAGQPTNPCVCSEVCADALFSGIGKDFEARRVAAGIPKWEPPRRVQLSRKKGARLPPNTAVVTRATKYGNPFPVGVEGPMGRTAIDKAGAVGFFCEMLKDGELRAAAGYPSDEQIKAELGGKNLACFCAEWEPCHTVPLLEIANG